MNSKLEKTPLFEEAVSVLEHSQDPLFLTGKAGTGKSTLLSYFRQLTKKRVAVLAPTGIAALNIGGETIHAFFRFPTTVTLEKAQHLAEKAYNPELYMNLDMIIIDEVSMVRADLLDCIHIFLKTLSRKKKPFGGIQMVFIGDLYQLPPVVTEEEKTYFTDIYDSPYFFSADVCHDPEFSLRFLELGTIYRQSDAAFIELLNAVREDTVTSEHLQLLNQRIVTKPVNDTGAIYLTSTNKKADTLNQQKLANIPCPIQSFHAISTGDFQRYMMPTESILSLAVGAQVMFVNNDSGGRWVNGTLGEIRDIETRSDTTVLTVETQTGTIVEVQPYRWSLDKYRFDPSVQQLTQDSMGSFTQFPLKLAWAITIHKSQGKTFERVIIDLGYRAFASGQTYVALSRCRSLEGISLLHSIHSGHLVTDPRIQTYLAGLV